MPSVIRVRRRTTRRAPEGLRPPVTPHPQALPHHFRPDGLLPPLPEQFTVITGQPPLTRTRHRILPPLLPLHLAQRFAGPGLAAVAAEARPESSRTAAATGRAAGRRATFAAPSAPTCATGNASDVGDGEGLAKNSAPIHARPLRLAASTVRPGPNRPPSPRTGVARDHPLPPPSPSCPHRGLPVQSRSTSPEPVPLSPGAPLPSTPFPPANDPSSAKRKRRPRAT